MIKRVSVDKMSKKVRKAYFAKYRGKTIPAAKVGKGTRDYKRKEADLKYAF
jgi:hypothetical protein